MKMDFDKVTRREILKLGAIGGLGLALGLHGCATIPRDVKWAEVSDKEFSIGAFDDWFNAHKLYNDINPNLKFGSAGHYPTFRATVSSSIGATPGIDYSSNRLYAAAEGIVEQTGDIDRLNTGRAGGLYVMVRHGRRTEGTGRSWHYAQIGNPARFGFEFHTHYAHLSSLEVEVGQNVKRGDLIGIVPATYWGIAKLMLTNRSSNYVNPDNYGPNHSYMVYLDGQDYSIEDIKERNDKQAQIWKTLCKQIKPETGIREGVMTQKMHRAAYQHKTCYWDNFTIMKYLTELYQARPTLFTDMPKDRFEEMKAEFFNNQPIILTLPLKA